MARIIICKHCNKEKELCAGGLCKPCYMHQYHEEHPEEKRANDRRWYKKHREKILASKRRHYQEHREAKLTYQRRYREENPEKIAASMRRWQRENRDKKATNEARRSARKRSLPDTLTSIEAAEILSIGRCFYCGEAFSPEDLTLDHFLPLSKGGGTTKANIIAACQHCNSSKGNKEPDELLRQLTLA